VDVIAFDEAIPTTLLEDKLTMTVHEISKSSTVRYLTGIVDYTLPAELPAAAKC
jgi:hypothetical protein